MEYAENNPTLDKYYERYHGPELLDYADDNGNHYKRIKLKYDKDNTYYIDENSAIANALLGNFHFVVVDENGNETILGGHYCDITHHKYGDANGHVYINPTRDASQARSGYTSTFALHLEQPSVKMSSGGHSGTFAANVPHEFTTHPDEANGDIARLEGHNLTLKYIQGEPAGTMEISAPGTPTGVDDIIADKVGDSADEDAPVEYYDLQGRRVMNPANGIFIERRGSHVTKRLMH